MVNNIGPDITLFGKNILLSFNEMLLETSNFVVIRFWNWIVSYLEGKINKKLIIDAIICLPINYIIVLKTGNFWVSVGLGLSIFSWVFLGCNLMEIMANYFFKSLHAAMLIPELETIQHNSKSIKMYFFCIQDHLNHEITLI